MRLGFIAEGADRAPIAKAMEDMWEEAVRAPHPPLESGNPKQEIPEPGNMETRTRKTEARNIRDPKHTNLEIRFRVQGLVFRKL